LRPEQPYEEEEEELELFLGLPKMKCPRAVNLSVERRRRRSSRMGGAQTTWRSEYLPPCA